MGDASRQPPYVYGIKIDLAGKALLDSALETVVVTEFLLTKICDTDLTTVVCGKVKICLTEKALFGNALIAVEVVEPILTLESSTVLC